MWQQAKHLKEGRGRRNYAFVFQQLHKDFSNTHRKRPARGRGRWKEQIFILSTASILVTDQSWAHTALVLARYIHTVRQICSKPAHPHNWFGSKPNDDIKRRMKLGLSTPYYYIPPDPESW